MAVTMLSSQTPAAVGTDGGPGITTGLSQRFRTAGSIVGVRFWSDGGSGTYTLGGWRVTASDAGAGGAGTELFTPFAFVGPVAAGWNEVSVTPIAITPDTVLYRAGVHHPTDYALTNGFFATGGPGETGLTNNDITADPSGSDPVGLGVLSQGTFTIDAAIQYPRQEGAQALYFVEFLFEPEGSGQEIAPTGIAVAAEPGTPALEQALSAAPAGIAVSAAPGAPAVAQVLSVAPAGIAVSAAPGTAALEQGLTAAPGGIAIAVTLGAPALEQAVEPGFAIAPAGIAVALGLGALALAGPAQPVPQGSWWSLKAILDDNRRHIAEDLSRQPVTCPRCSEPLKSGPGGVRWCPFDGWTSA